MLLVRITEFDGSDPIVLEGAEEVRVSKAVSSNKESGSFTISKNDPKAYIVNPDQEGYTKFWEIWDTKTNTRLNRGPIHSISDGSDAKWTVTGPGRSQIMADLIGTRRLIRAPIAYTIDDLRYENLATQPRTSTLIHDPSPSVDQQTVFAVDDIDEKYYGLSKSSKDFAIDESNGVNIRPGAQEPPHTYWTAAEYWAGTSRNDSLIVDLGDNYVISRINLGFPWWGGSQKLADRTYDFEVAYANDFESTITTVQGRPFGPFHQLVQKLDSRRVTGPAEGSQIAMGIDIYMGTAASGTSFAREDPFYTALNQEDGVNARYIRVHISDVHAWYGNIFDTLPSEDGIDYQCNPDYTPGSHDYVFISNSRPGVMADKVINDRNLEPANDCFAGIVELGAYRPVVSAAQIEPLGLQRIDNNNKQITYHHVPQDSEFITTSQGFRKFEPGGTFKKFTVTWSGATGFYEKFFSTDCNNCYPDGFSFGVLDQTNSLVYASDAETDADVDPGENTIVGHVYTKHILMKGADDARVTEVDTWPAKVDALSWGASYAYTEVESDSATVRFRGQSFKWYATVPDDADPGLVKIEIRSKNAAGTWSGWTTLEDNYPLPVGISSEPVYAISYESGTLVPETVYEIRITQLDGFVSIDSFEGYWSASIIENNEDIVSLSDPSLVKQIYDGRFSGGSAYKWNSPRPFAAFGFVGDRLIIVGAKGPQYGRVRMLLTDGRSHDYDPGGSNVIPIPGGEVDGSLHIDLNTGKLGTETAQAVIFDSDDYFTSPGLPWGFYSLQFRTALDNPNFSPTVNQLNNDSWINRCGDCDDDGSDTVSVPRFIYLDSLIVHGRIQVSAQFEQETHLDIMDSFAKALQVEWDVAEEGVVFKPRIGLDTDIILMEGHNTLVDWNIENDTSNIASMLYSNGADIDGLPLFAITEDKRARQKLKRTVMRKQDYRDVSDYFQLIGLSRTDLKKRRMPEKRITVKHIAPELGLNYGDSFILHTKKMGAIRVRINEIEISENKGGREYGLDCVRWPLVGTETVVPSSSDAEEPTADDFIRKAYGQAMAMIEGEIPEAPVIWDDLGEID